MNQLLVLFLTHSSMAQEIIARVNGVEQARLIVTIPFNF